MLTRPMSSSAMTAGPAEPASHPTQVNSCGSVAQDARNDFWHLSRLQLCPIRRHQEASAVLCITLSCHSWYIRGTLTDSSVRNVRPAAARMPLQEGPSVYSSSLHSQGNGDAGARAIGACAGLKDYGTSPDAPPRESVELRAYCFWEDLEPQEVAMQL